ncbi:Two-component sensor histidine kinase, contains HisKA and HATPase domains [Sphingomonas guangdongensis]|uniref:histidine kinase n=1 Tax=Sphingomonas guangdongensis TaxID=1141890 RepID=A0A285QBS4_9SPHN|nr:sensor histidine kinase [Sphingomonas guangdongensis]SOB79261.1 Two-component sensor histidine kinase, contains HisKA and HATPase domains [Sphingomonas guangdongensis]
MARIGELDIPDRLAPAVPHWVSEIGFGLSCAALYYVFRALVDLAVPGGAPFALLFPAVALATLFGRWRAGSLTAALTITYVSGVYYPTRGLQPTATMAISVGAVVVAAGGLIAICDLFRRAVRRAAEERDREIAERDLFLAEFDHRVKNNFALVQSLLELQRRRSPEPATQEALGTALTRVESIARAHRHLYRGSSAGVVEMRDYLGDLCAALADSLFLHGTIQLRCTADATAMPRDRAVSIGLVVNELVTNAVKHAFTGRDRGTIEVSFRNDGRSCTLSVADDGIGTDAAGAPASDGGLGSRLLDAFARQAGGKLHTDSDRTGTRVTLDLSER